MGNRVTAFSFIGCLVAISFAILLLSAAPAHASTRLEVPSLAQSIIGLVNARLCERQISLGGRLVIPLINPSKCASAPQPEEPTVTLIANPATITSGQSSVLSWTATNATSCVASNGWSGTKATSGSTSVSPSVTTTYVITCTGPGGSANDDAVVTVNTVTPQTPTVDITAEPTTITSGNSSTLTWDSTNATSCTASNGWTGTKTADGTQTVSPTVTTTYAITCTGAGGSANDSVTVTVNQPAPNAATVDLIASRTSVTPGPGSATTSLSWTSTNATSCTASGGTFTGTKGTSGSETITPSATTTYTLTCTGAGGDGSDSVTVNFVPTPDTEEPLPVVTLTANPTSVQEGSAGNATTTLSWVSTDATSCTGFGAGFAGSKATSGSEIVTPTQNTTYQLDCTGAGGTGSDDAAVTFTPAEEPNGTIGHVVISEVLYNAPVVPETPETRNEWIEIFNGSDSAVDLTGWTIGDLTASTSLSTLGTLDPGEFAVIVASTTPAGIPVGVSVLALHATIPASGLANGADVVVLRNATAATVDLVSWGTVVGGMTPGVSAAAGDGSTIARTSLTVDNDTAADWDIDDTPTPGSN